MTTYYRKNEDGSVMDWSAGKYADDCQETEKQIVQAWNGSYYIEDEVPEMSEDVATAKALEKAKVERANEVAAIKVTVGNKVFDGDEKAQSRMTRALNVAEITGMQSTVWILAHNTVAEVTVEEMKEALSKAMLAMGKLWTVPYTNQVKAD